MLCKSIFLYDYCSYVDRNIPNDERPMAWVQFMVAVPWFAKSLISQCLVLVGRTFFSTWSTYEIHYKLSCCQSSFRIGWAINAVHQLTSRPLLSQQCSLWTCIAHFEHIALIRELFQKAWVISGPGRSTSEPDKVLSIVNGFGDHRVKCIFGLIYIKTSSTAFHKLTQIW